MGVKAVQRQILRPYRNRIRVRIAYKKYSNLSSESNLWLNFILNNRPEQKWSEGTHKYRESFQKHLCGVQYTLGPGRYKVYGMQDGNEYCEEFNTILFAIGRDACTDKIGLDKVGVKSNPKNLKVYVDEKDRSNIPYVHAIGDIADGKLELTPVAIQAGRLLSERLFNNATRLTDYVNVATTVFTPLEYGAIGFSEEDAVKFFGESNIEVFHTAFWPLEWTVAHRPDNSCYCKLVCNKADDLRVVGFHYLGPNAGEVTQGFAVAIKMGATKAHFDDTIGIHPTTSENFTTLTITKSSGQSVDASGC